MILKRILKNDILCIGQLYYNDKFICDTLENLKYIIPTGIYNIKISYSPKFRENLPELFVPQRYGIRIHSGNYYTDSKGCILVGERNGYNLIKSKITLNKVIQIIKDYNINNINISEVI